MVANSSTGKDKFIDPILQLDERMQGILMDLALKFLPQESTAERSFEVTAALQLEIQDKDNELKEMLAHCNKLEHENSALLESNKKYKDKYIALKREYAQYREDLSDSDKNAMSGNSYEADMELERENDALKGEVKSLMQELAEMRGLREALAKAEAELADAELKARKAQEVSELQRRKLSSLGVENSKLKKNIEILYDVADKVKGLQKDKSRTELTNKMMNEQLQLQTKLIDELQEVNRKLLSEKEHSEKLLKFSEQNEKFWKQKATLKASESPDEKPKRENKVLIDSSPHKRSESFEFETKEGIYRNEIETLQNMISEITTANAVHIDASVLELNKQIDIFKAENAKLNKQLIEEGEMRSELEKVNEDLQSEVEGFEIEKNSFAETLRELQRTKKDRETLLEISERAQATLKDVDKAKAEIVIFAAKNEELEKAVGELRKSKEKVESQLRRESEERIKLGVKLAGSEEKAKFLKEELRKVKLSFVQPEEAANSAPQSVFFCIKV